MMRSRFGLVMLASETSAELTAKPSLSETSAEGVSRVYVLRADQAYKFGKGTSSLLKGLTFSTVSLYAS